VTAVFLIPLAGIAISLFLRDSVPDTTMLWIALFSTSLVMLAVSEIKAYMQKHKKIFSERAREQEAMVDLIKNRLLNNEKKVIAPGDEAKLVEQMANELKARLGSSKTLSAENIKQITSEMTSKIPH
jgi:hypothetical protein